MSIVRQMKMRHESFCFVKGVIYLMRSYQTVEIDFLMEEWVCRILYGSV